MKKSILSIALVLMLSVFSSSCVASYVPQDGIYIETTSGGYRSSIDFDVVVRYGTPYYVNGALQYYLYNGLYYYPFYHNNYWYVRVFDRPHLRPFQYGPNHRDYRFKPGRYQGFNRPQAPPPPPRRATPQQPNRISPQSRPAAPNRSMPNRSTPNRSAGRSGRR